MRTSLNETQLIERYLCGHQSEKEALDFKARLSGDKLLKLNVLMQRRVYRLLRQYHRKSLKQKAEVVQRHLFNDSTHRPFQESIYNLFNTFQ